MNSWMRANAESLPRQNNTKNEKEIETSRPPASYFEIKLGCTVHKPKAHFYLHTRPLSLQTAGRDTLAQYIQPRSAA